MDRKIFTSTIAFAQGIFYVVTGVWPIINRRSFEAVTGRKRDFWLVRTTGALITVIGAVMLLAAARREPSDSPEVKALSMGAAASLAGADVIFVSQKRIPRIYLLDAAAEMVFILLWSATILLNRKSRA
jgi:hypothetical protein